MARIEAGVEIQKKDLGSGTQGNPQETGGRMNTKAIGACRKI